MKRFGDWMFDRVWPVFAAVILGFFGLALLLAYIDAEYRTRTTPSRIEACKSLCGERWEWNQRNGCTCVGSLR